jgi:hypothetical protein
MLARLDAVALVFALFAGTMAIEDSHRLDAGASDDGLIAAAPASTCEQDQAQASAERDRRVAFQEALSIESGLIIQDTTDAPGACPDN